MRKLWMVVILLCLTGVLSAAEGKRVIYSGSGSTGGIIPIDNKRYSEGDIVTVLSQGTMVKAGSDFSGWSLGKGIYAETYQTDDVFPMGNRDIFLYALWEPHTVTVTYDSNHADNGYVPIDGTKYPYGSTITVLEGNGLSKQGSKMEGWNSAADGSGETCFPGDLLPVDGENVKLYANWKALPVTVTYRGGETESHNVGETITLPTKEEANSIFLGWSDGTTTYPAASSLKLESRDYTLSPVFKPIIRTVSFSADAQSQQVQSGTKLTLPEPLEKEGYRFLGWSDGKNTYQAGDSISVSSDLQLQATWQQLFHHLTITIESGDSVLSKTEHDHLEGESVTLPSKLDDKVGYHIASYTSGSESYQDSFTMGKTDVVLVGKLEGDPQQLTTTSDDGTVIASRTVGTGESYTLSEAPLKDGYHFVTWKESLSGDEVPSQKTLTMGSSATTYVAVYQKDPIVFTINAENPVELLVTTMGEGLTAYTEDGSAVEPALAKEWSVTADGKSITFTLRDALWSDGTPVTAQDVVDSWQWIFSDCNDVIDQLPLLEALAGASLVVVDDKTLTITRENAASIPEELTSSSAVVIAKAVRDAYQQKNLTSSTFVGSGAFLFSGVQNGKIICTKNPTYWDEASVKLDEIDFTSADADWVRTGKREVSFLLCQTKRGPLKDAHLRQALSLSLDRETLKPQDGMSAYGLVPSMDGYPEIMPVAGEEASVDNANASTSLIAVSATDAGKVLLDRLAKNWKDKLGITVEVRELAPRKMLESLASGAFDLALVDLHTSFQDPSSYLKYFTSGSPFNVGGYRNESYDLLIDEAGRLTDEEDRLGSLHTAEDFLINQDQGVIPLYRTEQSDVLDGSIWGGWVTNRYDEHPLKAVFKR